MIWWVIEGSYNVSNIWPVMHIHKPIIHLDLDTPPEIEIFTLELNRIYGVIKYVLLFVFDKFHQDLLDCF